MYETKDKIKALSASLENIITAINLPKKHKKIEVLEFESGKADLWSDPQEAKKVMQELSDLKKEIAEVKDLGENIELLKVLSDDPNEAEGLDREIAKTEKALKKFELLSFLSGKYDAKNALVSIHAGQGGTEAMDWVSMLYRMYSRYCERRDWKFAVLDSTAGEEAGIKSITFSVSGQYAYGYLKNEAGTHRLVRQSPFNADKLRQTSFALVEVLPELEGVDLPEIEIKDDDLEWQFIHSGGHGGQNVNKVATAVRLTHIPSGIVVTAQSERFQEQNRKNALGLLRAKLWIMEKERAKNEKKALKGDYRPASWGTQIRSYVLHPYKMVKDLRTQVETGNTDSVLDGDLDEFIDAELALVVY
ncbi:MAG: peptide chain release factor 2 [Patescibacteria group bacterium]